MADIVTNPQVNNQKTGTGEAGSKNFIVTAIVVLVILAVFAVGWFAIKSLGSSTINTTTTSSVGQSATVPEIKNDADFQRLEDELNKTDVDGLSTDLDANDADAAGF